MAKPNGQPTETENEANEEQNTQEEQPMTRGEVSRLVGNMVNSALTAHFKKPAFASMITEAVTGAVKAAMPKQEAAADGEGEGAPAKTGGRIDPKVAQLEQQLAQVRAENAENAKRAAETAERARVKEAESTLRTILAGKVRPEAVNFVIDAFKARGAIQFSEDGSPALRLPYSAAKGAKAELVDFDLEDGIGEWLKSSEASIFSPPPSGGGSGAPPAARNGRMPVAPRGKNPADMTPAERAASMTANLERLSSQEASKTGFGFGNG